MLFLIFILAFSSSQSQTVLPETLDAPSQSKDFSLIGTSKGLYYWDLNSSPVLLWKGASVRKIIKISGAVYLLTSKGIYFSRDLKTFEERNNGLSIKTIKHFENGKVSFTKQIQDLKDLEIDINNPDNLITCSKDNVYLSRDGGRNWSTYPNQTGTSGIKAVAVFSNPDLNIIMAHPFKGVYQRNITKNTRWKNISAGLYTYSGVTEEVSDILIRKKSSNLEIIASHNFSPFIYRYNDKIHLWQKVLKLKEDFAMVESLFSQKDSLYFVSDLGVLEFQENTKKLNKLDFSKIFNHFSHENELIVESLALFQSKEERYNFSQLWLLTKQNKSEYEERADKKKGLYLQAGIFRNQARLSQMRDFMEELKLNMVTVDMKDDYGHLRFTPRSKFLKNMSQVQAPVNLEKTVAFLKEKDIWLVARIVVFKDKVMYDYQNHKFAIRDKNSRAPWRGLVKRSNGELKLNQEYWVDPYSHEIWEYNVAIAQELLERGFDEIQFDYIRFPTDGVNLGQVHYPYQDPGMDRESALISFLNYARENIKAPLSIDIYGSNGWHRTGARTGQDVEMLQNYVDIICPMYYPSHFSQNFLSYPPQDQRTYRIYYYGSLRNYYIARKNSIIRSWIQAFKMNVS
ncbi:MAG: hypothetical protein CVV50_01610, partial [Spirochaetae bacterium HGW-Spirochaetae-6]